MHAKKFIQRYIDVILQKRIPSNELTRLAVKRHVEDLKKAATRKRYPYYFDEERAQHVINVFSNFQYTIGEWRGKPFELMHFQAFILWSVYGWRRKEDDTRRFRKVYIKMPRKNGKTELLAGIGEYMFAFDGENDPQVFWFATKKDQARIGWARQKELGDMLERRSSYLRGYSESTKYRIYTKTGLGYVAYLGRDSKTEDGTAPSCAIGDEYHAHVSDDMVNVMEDGMGSRTNAMTWLISTAGYSTMSPCARFERICEQILRGQIPGENIFAMIFGIDEGDDVNDPDVWRKANPAYDYISTLPSFLKSQHELAVTQGGSKMTSFLTKNLNVWTSTHDIYILDELYQKNRKKIKLEDLLGKECIGGLDLSAKRDLTALSLYFPAQTGLERPHLMRFCWLPKVTAEERYKKQSIPYPTWAKAGKIFLTEDDAIDYDYIYQTITGLYDTKISRAKEEKMYTGEGLMNLFKIKRIAYDRWREEQIVSKLIDAGVKMSPRGQGWRSMASPVDEIEIMFAKKIITHDANPVARWHYANVIMSKNPAGDRKPDKARSSEKIDIVVADLMAYGDWNDYKEEKKPEVRIYGLKKK